MPVDLALYQPDIANNTGTLIRLGACLGTTIHLIHPTGFPFSVKALARAGLDYVDHAARARPAAGAADHEGGDVGLWGGLWT